MDSQTLHSCAEFLAQGTAEILTLAKDHLSKVKIYHKPIFVICNTANSDDGDGEHWTVFFSHFTKTNILCTEFFDSFGNSPQFYKIYFPYKINKFNSKCVQNDNTDFCGQLCLYFIYMRLHRSSSKPSRLSFSDDKSKNENKAHTFYLKVLRRVQANKTKKTFTCKKFGCLPKHIVLTKYEAPK